MLRNDGQILQEHCSEVFAPGTHSTQQQKQTLTGAVVSSCCMFLRLSLCCSYHAHISGL